MNLEPKKVIGFIMLLSPMILLVSIGICLGFNLGFLTSCLIVSGFFAWLAIGVILLDD